MQTPSSNTSAATAGSSPRVLGAGSEGWKPLTGSELLLTGAFWFQPCGLNLMVTLGVLRRSRFTGELRTPPTPTGRPRPPEAESLRSGAFWGLVPAPAPLCTAGGGRAGTTGLRAPPSPARGLRGAGPRRGEARRGGASFHGGRPANVWLQSFHKVLLTVFSKQRFSLPPLYSIK